VVWNGKNLSEKYIMATWETHSSSRSPMCT
jgi:hypothetical protein